MESPRDVEVGDRMRRTPCAIVIDASASMRGLAISRLNAALRALERELAGDPTAHGRVELLVIRAGGFDRAGVARDWCDALEFAAPALEADGLAPLGRAMALALDRVAKQTARHAQCGLECDRPRILMIADGTPDDDDWERVAERCREAESQGLVEILAVGTAEADFDALARFALRGPARLDGLRFEPLLLWIGRSLVLPAPGS